MNRFEKLAAIDCGDKIEKKGKLSYLSWAWAWDQFKRIFPDSYFTVYETPDGCMYFTDGRTCWVKTGVTLVDGDYSLELIERLPVMDNRNDSIPLERITSRNVNDSIQRSLTKAVARHGLGLYVYAGEDLPDGAEPKDIGIPADKPPADYKPEPPAKAAFIKKPVQKCQECGKPILGVMRNGTLIMTPEQVLQASINRFGAMICLECANRRRKEHGA